MLLKTSIELPQWIFGLTLFLCLGINGTAQDATITINNLDVLCAGFGENSIAQVHIATNTPFRLPNNAGIVYDWYAYHENGQKAWHTPLEDRKMPTPWEGEYNIWAIIKYVNKTNLAPFNAFRSQVIKVNVEACPEDRRLPQRVPDKTPQKRKN